VFTPGKYRLYIRYIRDIYSLNYGHLIIYIGDAILSNKHTRVLINLYFVWLLLGLISFLDTNFLSEFLSNYQAWPHEDNGILDANRIPNGGDYFHQQSNPNPDPGGGGPNNNPNNIHLLPVNGNDDSTEHNNTHPLPVNGNDVSTEHNNTRPLPVNGNDVSTEHNNTASSISDVHASQDPDAIAVCNHEWDRINGERITGRNCNFGGQNTHTAVTPPETDAHYCWICLAISCNNCLPD